MYKTINSLPLPFVNKQKSKQVLLNLMIFEMSIFSDSKTY